MRYLSDRGCSRGDVALTGNAPNRPILACFAKDQVKTRLTNKNKEPWKRFILKTKKNIYIPFLFLIFHFFKDFIQ